MPAVVISLLNKLQHGQKSEVITTQSSSSTTTLKLWILIWTAHMETFPEKDITVRRDSNSSRKLCSMLYIIVTVKTLVYTLVLHIVPIY